LLFFLLSEAPTEVAEEMSHFDVGPTLLEAAGFSPNITVGFGKSYFPMGSETSNPIEAFTYSAPELITANIFKDGVVVDVTDMEVSIGATSLAITAPFSDDDAEFDTTGLFLVVFEDSGDLFDVLFTREPAKIAKELDKKAVVALAKPAAEAPWQLYVGRLFGASVFKGRTFVVQDTLALSGEQSSDLISRADFPASAPNIQSAKTSLIAHAGGAFQQNTYTNSLEALESNKPYFDLFEMDLIFTSDNELACLHDWGKTFERLFDRKVASPLKLDEFRSLTAGLEITPCDLSSLMGWLSENPSKYIVTDIKGRNIEALEQIADRYPELMDQIIPQVYQWGEYALATELGYDKIILTLYVLRNLSVPRLLQDVSENDYFAVTFPKSMGNELGELLASRGVRTYVHTVNIMQEANALKEKGVWGVYTDFLRD
jgi:glycerophosphoryl diester phosphodiesterase